MGICGGALGGTHACMLLCVLPAVPMHSPSRACAGGGGVAVAARRSLAAVKATGSGSLSLLDMLKKKDPQEFLEFLKEPTLEASAEACLEFPVSALALEACFSAAADLLDLLADLPTVGRAVDELAAMAVPECGPLPVAAALDAAGADGVGDYFNASASAGLKLCITGGKPAEFLFKLARALGAGAEEPKLCIAKADLEVLYRQVCTALYCLVCRAEMTLLGEEQPAATLLLPLGPDCSLSVACQHRMCSSCQAQAAS